MIYDGTEKAAEVSWVVDPLSNDRDTKYVATAPDEKAGKRLSDLPEKIAIEDTNTRCDSDFSTWTTQKSSEAQNRPQTAFSRINAARQSAQANIAAVPGDPTPARQLTQPDGPLPDRTTHQEK